ncbi:MAG: Crp/Fnr family transcriptional regulator [Gemmatimonadaceae bacterium]
MTDDFDFTRPQSAPATPSPEPTAPSAPFKPAQSRFYDAKVAEAVFRGAGKPERFPAGQALFVEEEKAKSGLFGSRNAARMYYVIEGEVALTHRGRPLDTVEAGEVFGEMAVVSERPRSATATAKSDTVAISLDRAALQESLGRAPEFALMLMSVMFDRLRFLAARLATRKAADTPAHESAVFNAATLEQFERALPRAATVRHWSDAVILREGQTGAFLYVGKSGRVALSRRGTGVAVAQAGSVFGERALVDQSPRTARAVAETQCELLQVDRPSLLAAVGAQPAFAMAMLRGVADRLRYMNEQLN